MAMMLRSEGIPARIVNGYAKGEYQEETSSYRVRSNNAHTWVEVYFPRYGWIIFEPTSSIPVVELPEGDAGGNPGDAFDNADPVRTDQILSRLTMIFSRGPELDLLADQLAAPKTRRLLRRRARKLVTRAVGGSALLLVAGAMVFAAN
jgi:transglutaminase-like putative cysteine protease